MRKHSIVTRLLGMVAAAFMLTVAAVLILTHFQTRAIIDASQNQIYEEKLNTIIKLLERREARLKATRMRVAYEEAFKEDVLSALRQTYYHPNNQRSYPFILDEQGRVILHPTMASADQALAGTDYIKQITAQRDGALLYRDSAGEGHWSRFHHFEAWHWIVGYSVPLETKYADAKRLRRSLTISMFLIVGVAMGLLSTVICRMVRPIKRLIVAAKAMQEESPAQALDTSRRDEIGTLARSFVAMRQAIEEKMTALSEADEDLKKSAELFRLLAQVSPVGIFRTDATGRCQYVNTKWCELAGLTPADAHGRGWERALHPDDREGVLTTLAHSLREGTPFADEFRFRNADGEERWLYGQAMLETNAAGEPQGLVGAITDITSRKDLEDQLRQAQKMEAIGTLAGGIAHDFNNLLTPIIGYAEMVQLELHKGSEPWADQQEVLKAATRASELVKQILSFSRQSERQLNPLPLQPVVAETIKLLRSSIPSTIEIRSKLAQVDVTVKADPTQIQQLLMNLCTNANYAMREHGGILSIALHPMELDKDEPMVAAGHLLPGPHALLTISDTGCGIPPATRDRIFEPYFTTKPSGDGTGMGLAMVHGIIKSHAGHITVASTAGRGTTFQIYLPRTNAAEQAPVALLTDTPVSGHERILVVDDEVPIAKMIAQILARAGYDVTAATGSADALRTFTLSPDDFDLVITDMTMPHMSGAAMSRRLLTVRPDLPIIMCTGFSATFDSEQAAALGVRDFLMKPVRREQLLETVRAALDGRTILA